MIPLSRKIEEVGDYIETTLDRFVSARTIYTLTSHEVRVVVYRATELSSVTHDVIVFEACIAFDIWRPIGILEPDDLDVFSELVAAVKAQLQARRE
jgi:hypothetical protein